MKELILLDFFLNAESSSDNVLMQQSPPTPSPSAGYKVFETLSSTLFDTMIAMSELFNLLSSSSEDANLLFTSTTR